MRTRGGMDRNLIAALVADAGDGTLPPGADPSSRGRAARLRRARRLRPAAGPDRARRAHRGQHRSASAGRERNRRPLPPPADVRAGPPRRDGGREPAHRGRVALRPRGDAHPRRQAPDRRVEARRHVGPKLAGAPGRRARAPRSDGGAARRPPPAAGSPRAQYWSSSESLQPSRGRGGTRDRRSASASSVQEVPSHSIRTPSNRRTHARSGRSGSRTASRGTATSRILPRAPARTIPSSGAEDASADG